MNISAIWFYTILAVSVCGGYGIGSYVAPSEKDIELASRVAREVALRECVTPKEHVFMRGEVTNSPGKGY